MARNQIKWIKFNYTFYLIDENEFVIAEMKVKKWKDGTKR